MSVSIEETSAGPTRFRMIGIINRCDLPHPERATIRTRRLLDTHRSPAFADVARPT